MPGDRFAVALRNGLDIVVAIWAAARAGLVFVGLSTKLAPTQWAYMLAHSGATLALGHPEFMDGLHRAGAEAGLAPDRIRDVGDHLTGRRRPWRGAGRRVPRRGPHLRGHLHLGHHRAAQGQPGRAPGHHALGHRLRAHAGPHRRRPHRHRLPALLHHRPRGPGHADDARRRHVGAGARRRAPRVRPADRPAPYHLPDGRPFDLAAAPARQELHLARPGPRRDRRVRRLAGAHLHHRRPAGPHAPAPPLRRLRADRDPLAGHHPAGLGVPPEARLGRPPAAVRRRPGRRRRRSRCTRRRGRRAVDQGARW